MVQAKLDPDICVFRIEDLGFFDGDETLVELAPSSKGRGGHEPEIAKYPGLGWGAPVVNGGLRWWRWRRGAAGAMVEMRVHSCWGDRKGDGRSRSGASAMESEI